MSVMSRTTTHPCSPQGETRIAVRGASWRLYELWVDSLPPRSSIRMAFDGEDLEIMTKGPKHEDYRSLLGKFVGEISVDLSIPHKCLGETTWKRPKIARGLEADQCYGFRPEKLAAVAAAKPRDSHDVDDYPNPDLVIEIDLSPSLIDRASIYPALRVTESWRFDGETAVIERLGANGHYEEVSSSTWISVRSTDIVPWLTAEDTSDELAWGRKLRQWVRETLVPRTSS